MYPDDHSSRPSWIMWSEPGATPPPPAPPPMEPPPPPRRSPGASAFVAILVIALTLGYLFAGYEVPGRDGDTGNPLFDFGGRAEQTLPPEASESPDRTIPADVAAVAAKVTPSVVNITTSLGYQSGTAAGTGIVISPSGEVLTNYHVIDGATRITVDIGGSGSVYTATVLGRARTEDVALLQIQGVTALKAAQTGDVSKVSIGDDVVAIGNALGRGGVPEVTSGTVTALDQAATAHDPSSGTSEMLEGLIETNVPLQPGDSGGPLIDDGGRVIGMNTAASGIGRGGSAGNIGLAIPVDRAIAIANQIRSGRATATVQIGPRGFLGISVSRARNNVSGAPVASVGQGTPAESAGMARGDVIISIDGTAVDTPTALTSLLEVHRPGETVNVGWVDSSGQQHSARIRLGGGPSS